jgi:hypothetical protein
MDKQLKYAGILLGAALVLAVGVGLAAFGMFSGAYAQSATPTTPAPSGPIIGPGAGEFFHFKGWEGPLAGPNNRDQYLADALGITLEELQAAQQKATTAILAQAVQDGQLTQEQADLIQAQMALKALIDPQAILAQALGISTDTLQTYQDQGMSMADILNELGLTADELRTKTQAAYEAAIQAAVSDGVITQAQADQILSENQGFGFDFGFGRGGHGMRGGPHGGYFNFGGSQTAPQTTPEVTPSSSTGGDV